MSKCRALGDLKPPEKCYEMIPNIKIIALTVYEGEPFPTKLLQAGAIGYLTKGAGIGRNGECNSSGHAGKRYLGPEIAQQMALKPLQITRNLLLIHYPNVKCKL